MKLKLSKEHVTDVLEMYSSDSYGKRKIMELDKWIYNGHGCVALFLRKSNFLLPDADKRKKATDKNGEIMHEWTQCTDVGDHQGQLVLSMFTGTIIEFASRLCDISKVKNSYGVYLKSKGYVTMCGKKVKLEYLDQMCRMMQCMGADTVDVFKKCDKLQFVANVESVAHCANIIGKHAIVCVVMCCGEDSPVKTMGGIVVHDTYNKAAIDESLAVDKLKEAKRFLVQAQEDMKNARSLFRVRLVKIECMYVLANTSEEARSIADDNAYTLDWDDSAETDHCEEVSFDELDEDDTVYDNDGEVEYEDLEEMFCDEEED